MSEPFPAKRPRLPNRATVDQVSRRLEWRAFVHQVALPGLIKPHCLHIVSSTLAEFLPQRFSDLDLHVALETHRELFPTHFFSYFERLENMREKAFYDATRRLEQMSAQIMGEKV